MATFRDRTRVIIRRLVLILLCSGAAVELIEHARAADSSPATARFQLAGSGTLAFDQPVQSDGLLRLKAYLTPADAALAASPPVQEDGNRFALMASATTQASVCYNDTIFRDDFDGDGG
jgi:hypothetical protein